MKRRSVLLAYLTCVFTAIPALAQAPPDAGVLQQQIERERKPVLPSVVIPAEPTTPSESKPAEGIIVTVKSFQFAGNSLLSNEELAPVIANFLDRPLDFSELQQAAAAVANAYRKRGWVAQAYLPRQEISEGIVTIQIIEALFGGAQLEGAAPSRVKVERLLTALDVAQPKDEGLNADKLDRALLLLDDLPGVTVYGSLQKGQRENETVLLFKALDEALFRGDVGIDNSGSHATGKERINGNVYLNSPLGIGDQAIANLSHTRGNDYGRLAYSIPMGDNGWRVNASASYLKYDLVADEFIGLDGNGVSSTLGLDVNYPIIRSRQQNLYLGLGHIHKRFDNEASQTTTTRYEIDDFSISLNGNRFDKLGGGGANAAGVTLTRGRVDLGSLDLSEDARLEGSFSKLNYFVNRRQMITGTVSGFVALTGQAANENLDSAESFYLGGVNGVRAYPSNEGGGSAGRLVNMELSWRLPQSFALTGFYDWGQIHVNQDNYANNSPNRFLLKGAGLALGWEASFGLNLNATWARRIGDNPNSTTTGNDQDGTLVKNRWWLTSSLSF